MAAAHRAGGGEPTAAEEGPPQPPLRTTRQCFPVVLTRRSALLIPKTEPRAQTACQLNSRQSAAAPPPEADDEDNNEAAVESAAAASTQFPAVGHATRRRTHGSRRQDHATRRHFLGAESHDRRAFAASHWLRVEERNADVTKRRAFPPLRACCAPSAGRRPFGGHAQTGRPLLLPASRICSCE